jgi:LmbE family N-acetylglucosaminyl deacetylase
MDRRLLMTIRIFGPNALTPISNISCALNLKQKGVFLFISPHDDDAALSVGLTLLLAVEMGIEVHVCIATDGARGFGLLADAQRISQVRHEETIAAYSSLGIPREHISWLGFPDGGTWRHVGGADAGMEVSLTQVLRRVKPAAVFTTCREDTHSDHQAVHMAVRAALCHAVSGIWEQFGDPIELPVFVEWQTATPYTVRKETPMLRIIGDKEHTILRCEAVRCWKSQAAIIAPILTRLQAEGLEERLWIIDA